MTEQRSIERPKTIGLSLFFTVFLILALITFAAISLVEARNDLESSQRVADRITAYQDAANRAEERLDALQQEAASDRAPETVSWTEPIDERQELSVAVELNREAARYRIKAWSVISRADWTPEETIPNLFILD